MDNASCAFTEESQPISLTLHMLSHHKLEQYSKVFFLRDIGRSARCHMHTLIHTLIHTHTDIHTHTYTRKEADIHIVAHFTITLHTQPIASAHCHKDSK